LEAGKREGAGRNISPSVGMQLRLTGRNLARGLPSKMLQNRMPGQHSLNKYIAKMDQADFV
jgi:hypothetical protein